MYSPNTQELSPFLCCLLPSFLPIDFWFFHDSNHTSFNLHNKRISNFMATAQQNSINFHKFHQPKHHSHSSCSEASQDFSCRHSTICDLHVGSKRQQNTCEHISPFLCMLQTIYIEREREQKKRDMNMLMKTVEKPFLLQPYETSLCLCRNGLIRSLTRQFLLQLCYSFLDGHLPSTAWLNGDMGMYMRVKGSLGAQWRKPTSAACPSPHGAGPGNDRLGTFKRKLRWSPLPEINGHGGRWFSDIFYPSHSLPSCFI